MLALHDTKAKDLINVGVVHQTCGNFMNLGTCKRSGQAQSVCQKLVMPHSYRDNCKDEVATMTVWKQVKS